MNEATQFLDIGRRHLCEVDEIVDRLLVPERSMSHRDVDELGAAACNHISATNEILDVLEELDAATEIGSLFREVERISWHLFWALKTAGGGHDNE